MTAQRSDSEPSTAIPTYEQSLIDEHGAEAVANYRADTVPALRYGDERTALQVGAMAPEFTLTDAAGMVYTLNALRKTGPVVAIFYRGGWCPFCNVQLRAFQLARMHLRAHKANVVLISPEQFQHSLTLSEQHSLQFPVLSDVGNTVARQYGVAFQLNPEQRERHREHEIDLVESNGDAQWELPMPATFVIDRSGRIRYAFVSADYTQRAEPSEVLAVLQRLTAGR